MAVSAPEKKYNAGVYSYTWQNENLRVLVDHLAESSKGELTGEINAITTAPGRPGHVHWARFNLTSTQGRNTVIKACSERLPELDWYAIIEQVCVFTMEKYREGEPVLPLGDKPEYTARRYRVYPLLLEGEPNLLYAPGKTGKSYLALYLGCLVQFNHVGIANWIPESGNVLLLDYETSYRSYKQRCWAVMQGLDLNLEFDAKQRILYRRCYQPLPMEISNIQKLVIANKIDLVIVDSAGYASGGDPNDASIALSYYGALNSLKVTSLTLDHVSKNSLGEKTPFGSVYKTNSARNVWELQKNQEAGDEEYDLGVYHRAMNDGMLLRPIGYHVKFTNDDDGNALKVEFKIANLADNAELSKGLSLTDRIANYLSKNGMSEVKDISEALSEDANQVKSRLNENKKRFKHFQDGWGLLVANSNE